ncbi:hypothetical protein EYW98_18370 [Escherichia coli]|nr:hypothetical protein [Escherichia coli]EGO8378853.1 hypothetical protein [Escherichia coli]
MRCGGLLVNYIKTVFHYFFEPERIPERFCCGVGKFIRSGGKVLPLRADNLCRARPAGIDQY